jgi:hypothetical protein
MVEQPVQAMVSRTPSRRVQRLALGQATPAASTRRWQMVDIAD